jgi:hypothetical protein
MAEFPPCRSNFSKPITVNGVRYESLNKASIQSGFDRATLRKHMEQHGSVITIAAKRNAPNSWTFDRVHEVAKSCESRTEFWKKFKGAALKAQRQGWLEQVYGHMEFVKHNKGHWQVIENVQIVAKTCETRTEFQEKYPAAYASANSNGWLDVVCTHMVVRKSSGEVAVRKFLLRHGIYSVSQKKFSDCKDKRPLPFDEYLPEFGVLIEIQGIQHKVGWGQNSESQKYIAKHDEIKRNYAEENGFKLIEVWDFREDSINSLLLTELESVIIEKSLDRNLKSRELTEDEMFNLKSFGQWTLEKVAEAAQMCTTLIEFESRFPYAYAKSHKAGWAKDVHAHLTRILQPKGHWTKERLIEVAKQCSTRGEFQKRFMGAYQTAAELELLDELCQHMKSMRVPAWTLELIKNAAIDCKTYSQFKTQHPSAYNVARRNGWLEVVRGHMSQGQLPHGYWNILDNVLAVAKNCKTKSEFGNRFGSARNAAKKHGWMDIVCAHMN